MAVVDMNKISLIGLNRDKDAILETLMKIGAVQVIDVHEKTASKEWEALVTRDGEEETAASLEREIEKLRFSIEFLSKYDTAKKPLFETKRTITQKELETVLKNRDRLESVLNEIAGYDSELTSLKGEKNRQVNLIESLDAWKTLPIPLEVTSTQSTTVSIGVIPSSEDPDALIQELAQKVEESHVQLIHSDGEYYYFMVIYYSALEQSVLEVLKIHSFSRITFKDVYGTAQENIDKASKEIGKIEEEIARIEKAIVPYMDERGNLEILHDHLAALRDRKRALNHMVKTDTVFMLEGWIPEHLGKHVESLLTGSWDCIATIYEPEEDEEIPVLLKNNRLGTAVEPVTKMYSLPDYKEIDPNVIMAPFFILFFGLMLSDGGYGLTIVAFAGVILWKVKLEENIRKFMTMMLYCGFSTMFWGLLFGGWFGIPALAKHPVWFNPAEDPETMLAWSLLFGIIHLYVGMAVRGLNLIRRKKYLDIVFDVLIWYVFFTGFALFALPYVPKMDAEGVKNLVSLGKILLAVGAVLLVLSQGRKEKGVGMRFFKGIASLYDLVSFMSDVLSYSRLLALGLATSVIASIVNQLGASGGLNNIFSILLFIVVLLIGHAFNFAINALGAYVHSSRLQYIEFFGKFYKGGGTPFEPLEYNTKFTNLKN